MIKIKNIYFFNDNSFDKMANLITNLEVLDLSYTKITYDSLNKII